MVPAAWIAALWLGAPVYIDGDVGCPGDGSDASPFCSLQAALDAGPLDAGDELLFRDADDPYEAAGAVVEVVNRDGTSDDPLVLAADEGHTPVLRHRVRFINSSHWIVRGLTFEGTGLSEARALDFGAFGQDVTNVRVEGNAFYNWGGAYDDGSSVAGVVVFESAPEDTFGDVVVSGNDVQDCRGRAVYANRVDEVRIEHNTIEHLRCHAGLFDAAGAVVGIHVARARDGRVRGNTVRFLDAAECQDPGANAEVRVLGIVLEAQDDTEVVSNWVSDVASEADGRGMGINVAQDSDEAWVHHNVVVDASLCGLCDDVNFSVGGDRSRFEHNTVLGGDFSLLATHPDALVVQDNVFSGASTAAVRMHREPIDVMDTTPLSWTFERNLYNPASSQWVFEYSDAVSFEDWQSGCACDATSVEAEAGLSSEPEDYTPAPSSVAIDLGDSSVRLPFNGAAPDAGAFEAPEVVSAVVFEDDPDQLVVTLAEGGVLPMRFDAGCAGFSVTADTEEVPLSACEALGDAVLSLRMTAPVLMGQEVVLEYGGPWVRDSAAVGGVLDAVLQPVSVEVDNRSAQTSSGDDTSGGMGSTSASSGSGGENSDGSSGDGSGPSSGSASSAGDTGDVTAGAEGGFPSADGCTCTSGGDDGWPLWLLVLVALRSGARRRHGSTAAAAPAHNEESHRSPASPR